MPAKNAHDRRRRKTDEAIRRAFFELLSQKDLKDITVKELAERADIDRKTFYLRHSSIDDLVDYLLREDVTRLSELLATETVKEDGSLDIPKLFEGLGEELVTAFDAKSTIFRHVGTDALIGKLRPALVEVLSQRDTLSLSRELGPYFELFVSFFCSGLLTLYHQWLETDSELPLEDLSALASSAVTGGISALTSTAQSLDIPVDLGK